MDIFFKKRPQVTYKIGDCTIKSGEILKIPPTGFMEMIIQREKDLYTIFLVWLSSVENNNKIGQWTLKVLIQEIKKFSGYEVKHLLEKALKDLCEVNNVDYAELQIPPT